MIFQFSTTFSFVSMLVFLFFFLQIANLIQDQFIFLLPFKNVHCTFHIAKIKKKQINFLFYVKIEDEDMKKSEISSPTPNK